MIYTLRIQRAIRFALRTHEVYQKQKRKGKDIPYIIHPLIAGIILSHAGAEEDLIIAGILHDSIEDTVKDKWDTRAKLIEKFGDRVAELVDSVTESVKDLPWEERKAEALEHIKTFSKDSILLKSADVISNMSETVNEYEKQGETAFSNFNAPKEKIIQHALNVINALLEGRPESPLSEDLVFLQEKLNNIKNTI